MSSWKQHIRAFTIFDWTILLNAITILYMRLIPFGILAIALAWMYLLVRGRVSFQALKTRGFWLLSIPFSWSLIGLIYTENIQKAGEDIGRILPFLLFLFFFSTASIKKEVRIGAVILFCSALITYLVVHLVDGIGSYLSTSDISQLFYTNLVYDTNTVSIFNLFAVFALFECFINSKSTKWNWILGVVLAFLTLYMLMLQSRIIIFSMLLGYVVLFFVYWKSVKKWALVALLLFSGALFLIPAFQGRFGSVVEQSQAIEATTENQPVDAPAPTNIYINDCSTSTSLRYYALISSLEVIKNNPIFGVGTGDWRDELVKVYHKNELRCNIKEETAPHNQYVRTVLKFGVIGFLFFGFLFLQFMLKSLREKAIGQASIVISVLLAAVGYDLLDGGGTAPFVAFFLFLLFPSSSFSSNNQLKP